MKKCNKKTVIVVLVIAVLIVIADLIMFYTSAQDTGIGRGFSRFWDK
ncbi:MAG: hypothetical protein RBS01_01930 [Candidatus Dojkabacteria bacterium]|jgi:hypothetical protein|nr:hypothetical protein [Candidatus Dojkabacteria bacterium]